MIPMRCLGQCWPHDSLRSVASRSVSLALWSGGHLLWLELTFGLPLPPLSGSPSTLPKRSSGEQNFLHLVCNSDVGKPGAERAWGRRLVLTEGGGGRLPRGGAFGVGL